MAAVSCPARSPGLFDAKPWPVRSAAAITCRDNWPTLLGSASFQIQRVSAKPNIGGLARGALSLSLRKTITAWGDRKHLPRCRVARTDRMPFKSETYRILIESPSDLEEERIVVADAINEWNAQYAATKGMVLLPMKWETHAVPQTGIRPQEAINRQLVNNADLLVGMFWTKVGTNTGGAVSGTVEEIDRVVAAGKPTMLYFSSRPIDPGKIDLKQQKKLRQFKDATYKMALVGGFRSLEELHKTVLRDLTNLSQQLKSGRTTSNSKLEQTSKLAELMIKMRENDITPDALHQFRKELLAPAQRTRAQTT